MEVCRDYEELFKVLNVYRIKYLVVGAHAVIFYTEPRFTKDMDVWIPPDLNDPQQVFMALRRFGAPLRNVSPEDFKNKQMILQIGVAPVRIDIMMAIAGVHAKEAWKNRVRSRYGRTPINILGLGDLVKAKKTAGRPEDGFDLRKLLKNKNK